MKPFFPCFVAVTIVLFFSCVKAKKNVEDYLPKVRTVSATVNTNGDVIVQGEVDLKGQDSLLAVGFCVDTLPEPYMLKNQREFNMPVPATFSTQYKNFDFRGLSFRNFDRHKTYYFRSWAANNYGYIYGNIIALNGIMGTPVDPPCTLSSNYLDFGTGAAVTSFTTYCGGSGENWIVGIDSPLAALEILFGSKPVTRTFITHGESSDPDGGGAIIRVNEKYVNSASSPVVHSGTTIYVKEVSDSTFEISICNAPWDKYQSPGYTTVHLNARVMVKY